MRIGVVGTGVIGGLRCRAIREHPDVELAAVYDPDAAAAGRAAAGTSAVVAPSLQHLLDAGLDAVMVSSPVHLHEEACLGAFARGLHVLCEKPLANTVESCQRIVEAADAAQRALAVGFNLRYYPAIAFVKHAIDAGQIGKLDHLRLFGGHEGLPKFRSAWEYRAPESGGGATMDIGVHLTDLARYLLGEITEVYGIASEAIWQVPGSEDNAVALFRNPEGCYATYHATWTEWTGYRLCIEAYGERGMVRGEYGPMRTLLVTQDKPGGTRTSRRRAYLGVRIREKLFGWQDSALRAFRAELADFLAMAAGRPAGPLADGHAGLRSVEVSRAIRESGARREVIKLPALERAR